VLGRPRVSAPTALGAPVGRPICEAGARGCRRSGEERWSAVMNELLLGYLPILIFLGIAGGLAAVILLASYVLARQRPDAEKLSPYECGFEPFEDSRGRFDVRFYLVAILFIIFDLEVAFLFPWAVALGNIGLLGFWSMMIFLGVLTIGFIYEWKKGALEWE
jgi:NADH-quinone oxidoreductase subunit A